MNTTFLGFIDALTILSICCEPVICLETAQRIGVGIINAFLFFVLMILFSYIYNLPSISVSYFHCILFISDFLGVEINLKLWFKKYSIQRNVNTIFDDRGSDTKHHAYI